jgi:hypothetical protein
VRSRKYRNQVKEIKIRVVLYNLNKWIQKIWFIVIKGILQSQHTPLHFYFATIYSLL